MLVCQILASPQCVLATLHRFDKAGFLLEISRQNFLHQLVGSSAVLGGGLRQLCFKFRGELYFHLRWAPSFRVRQIRCARFLEPACGDIYHSMAQETNLEADQDMLPEYDFTHGLRGQHHEACKAGTNVVLLESEIEGTPKEGAKFR